MTADPEAVAVECPFAGCATRVVGVRPPTLPVASDLTHWIARTNVDAARTIAAHYLQAHGSDDLKLPYEVAGGLVSELVLQSLANMQLRDQIRGFRAELDRLLRRPELARPRRRWRRGVTA